MIHILNKGFGSGAVANSIGTGAMATNTKPILASILQINAGLRLNYFNFVHQCSATWLNMEHNHVQITFSALLSSPLFHPQTNSLFRLLSCLSLLMLSQQFV